MGVRRRGARRGSGKGNAGDDAGASEAVQQPTRGATRAASGLKPSEEEVLAAIETLYDDGLKPFGRILRKRLAERAAPAGAREELEQPRQDRGKAKGGSTLPDIDVKHLQNVCEECERLDVRPEEGGDWSAVFNDRDEEFVDIYSSTDSYSAEFWAAASEHFGKLPKDAMQLPGGRYSCAQMLMKRDLPFLAGLTLGKVCHFVQLAISTRKVLGYADGSVVPYAHSQSMVKEQCAESQQPCAGPGAAGAGEEGVASMPFATWDNARRCLREILADASAAAPDQGPSQVPLSNVKRLFRSKFNVELSETFLGHSKLSDLLQDHRFRDVCSVQLQGQGYIVVQKTDPHPEEATPISLDEAVPQEPNQATTLSLGELLAAQLLETPFEPLEEEPPRRVLMFNCGELGGLDEAGYEDACWQPLATGAASTPLQSPGVPPSCTVRRWHGESTAAPVAQFLSATGEPLVLDGLDFGMAGGFDPYAVYERDPEQQRPRRVEFCPDEPLIFGEDTFGALATPLPSPGVPTSTTVRRWPQGAVAHIAPYSGMSAAAVGASIASSREDFMATPPLAAARSPGVRWQVQNTFIHAAGPPATPVPGARRRSQSLPRSMGTSLLLVSEAEAALSTAALGVNALGARLCDSAAESTVDNGSAASGSAIGLQPPASPAPSSTGTPERPTAVLPSATPESTPVKVPLERLESLGCLSDEGLRTPSQRRRVPLCPELEDGGGLFADATPQSRRAPCTTPSKSRDSSWIVQNTFIHAKAAPPTPAPGARLRARSVPKDSGSIVRPCAMIVAPTPPPQPMAKRSMTGEGLVGIDVAPAFVMPPSPALVPPTPQSPLYSGSFAWPAHTLPKARAWASPVAEDHRVIRLSDHL